MNTLQEQESTRNLVDRWVADLAQVVESMTDQRPAVQWRAANGAAAGLGIGTGPDMLWSSYKLRCPEQADIWIVTPKPTWEHLGTATLQATGLEASNSSEIRKTWLEILSQWVAAFVRSAGSHIGREVSSEDAGENSTDIPCEWLFASLRFGDKELAPIAAAFSPALLNLLTAPDPADERSSASLAADPDASPAAGELLPSSRTLDLLLDVELPVSISFGKTQLPLKDVLKLTTGSIVELNRGISEPVEVLVNHCLVARGEVVVVEGNYGIRIQQIASRQDRLRTVR